MDENIKKNIGRRINEVLAEKGIMQKQLANRIGVTDNTISYYLSGKRYPDIEKLIEIARCLGVSTDYLLGISSVSTTDTDIKTICESTGLSEESFYVLQYFKSANLTEYIDTINFFIESELDTMWNDYEIDTLTISEEREKLSHNQKLKLVEKFESYLMGDYKNNKEEIQVSDCCVESNIDNVVLGAYRINTYDIVERVLLDKIVDSLKAAKAYF